MWYWSYSDIGFDSFDITMVKGPLTTKHMRCRLSATGRFGCVTPSALNIKLRFHMYGSNAACSMRQQIATVGMCRSDSMCAVVIFGADAAN